jgi:hypothetical protein
MVCHIFSVILYKITVLEKPAASIFIVE